MSSRNWNFRITPVRIGMFAIFAIAVLMILFRFYTGLGFNTNLSDGWPWGAWIGADMNVIALAGAGFSMAIITHIFHIEKYKPLSRRCLLISFIGYVLVLLILIIGITSGDHLFLQTYIHQCSKFICVSWLT